MISSTPQLLARATLRSAAAIYFLIALPVIFALILGLILDRHFALERWEKRQLESVSALKVQSTSQFYDALSDLLILAENHFLFSGLPATNNELATRFDRLARFRRSYHQLRFIDVTGQELVRVNFRGDAPQRISGEQLQNKSHRAYFQRTIGMLPSEVYISRFDLNLEHNEIEQPLQPVIRYATPVFDTSGKKTGILVLNYLGEKLLRQFAIYERENSSRILLLNSDGYYLYSDNPEYAWGFQLAGRPSFADQFPEWSRISGSVTGQFSDARGLFTYTMVSRLAAVDHEWLEQYTPIASVRIKSEEPPWRIVSFVTQKQLYAATQIRMQFAMLALLALLILLLPASFIWGRSRAEAKELAIRNRIYAQVLEQSDELIYITDTEGTIRYANSALERHTGYPLAEVIGNTPRMFKSGKFTDNFYQRLWHTIKHGRTFESIFINRRKDGTLFYELKTITPLLNPDGKVTQYVSTGRDISSTKRLREHEMEVVSQVAGGLSHHFGNYLNAIKGFSALALANIKEGNEASNLEYINEVLTVAAKAETLLSSIRAIAYTNFSNLPIVDLASFLQETIESIRSGWPKNIVLNANLANKVLQVQCLPELIMTAILALLDNARDAVGDQGEIEIGLGVFHAINTTCVTCDEPLNSTYVEISISDSGKGIAPNIRNKIWDPFFSTKGSSQLVGNTPGLGLSAVRSIIHTHRGHIRLSSNDKGGATFHLLLPMAQNKRMEAADIS